MTEMNNGEMTQEEMDRQSVTAFHIAKLQAEVERLDQEVKTLTAERERLNKALEQLRTIVDRYYDDCFDVDAGDPTVVWGFQWEDGW